MTDQENKTMEPQQEPAQESAPLPTQPAQPAGEGTAPTPEAGPAPAPAQPPQGPASSPVNSNPYFHGVPTLTLEPDPPTPPMDIPEPPRAPEPPEAPAQEPPVQYATYNYNFNVPPETNYQQAQQPQNPQQGYSGYQPPNYTSQSYQPPQAQQPKYTTPPMGYQQKSRLAAGLLGIMLGSLGIHNFYLGFNSRGVIQLVLSLAGGLLTCGLGTVAAAIWGFIEGVSLLSSSSPRFDGNGVILRD